MENLEIEVKIQISTMEYERMHAFFQKTAIFKSTKHQIDNYYSPIDEDYYNEGDRCLRVRVEDGQSILSYKQIHNENSEMQFIEEYETIISDIEAMDKILKSIGFTCRIIVDKYRKEFLTEDGYYVALDKVEKLGFFIEIENRNIDDSVEERNRGLINFVKELKLNLTARNYEGYSNMIHRMTREEDESV